MQHTELEVDLDEAGLQSMIALPVGVIADRGHDASEPAASSGRL
jgi:hypothetical protein